MIKINYIKPIDSEVLAYGPDNNCLGRIYFIEQLNDLRIQIAKVRAEGYYITFKGEKLEIQPNGVISDWPEGLFTTAQHQYPILYRLRSDEKGGEK